MLIYKSRHWGGILEIDDRDDVFEVLFRIFEIKGSSFECWDEAEFRAGISGMNSRFMTLEAIGHQLGVTKHRIRQIEAKALRKLRYGKGNRAILREFL